MKEGWKYKKLGEVVTFARGLTYSKKDEVEYSKNVVLRSNNIDLLSGKLDFSELKYLDESFEIPADKRVKQGSLFICMSNGSKAHLGKVAYVNKDYNYAFGGFMGQITPTNDVDGLYLHYALSSPLYKGYIKSLSEGANINNLKFKDLSEFIIGYPSLSEQRSIVSRLDAAFAGIDALKANAERQLAEARALFNRALTEEMTPKEGWEEKNVACLCKIINGYAFPSTSFSNQEGVKSIKITNVGVGVFIDDGKNNLPKEYLNTAKDVIVYESDIVIALTRTIISDGLKVAIVPESYNRSLLNQRVAALRAFPQEVVNAFLYYFFKSQDAKKYVLKKVNTLMQPNLSIVDLRKMPVPCPSLETQHSIVTRLDALSANVRKLEEVQRKTLVECEALKQAMLKEVFE